MLCQRMNSNVKVIRYTEYKVPKIKQLFERGGKNRYFGVCIECSPNSTGADVCVAAVSSSRALSGSYDSETFVFLEAILSISDFCNSSLSSAWRFLLEGSVSDEGSACFSAGADVFEEQTESIFGGATTEAAGSPAISMALLVLGGAGSVDAGCLSA